MHGLAPCGMHIVLAACVKHASWHAAHAGSFPARESLPHPPFIHNMQHAALQHAPSSLSLCSSIVPACKQEVQEGAELLLTNLLNSLVNCYPLGTYAPSAATAPHQPHGLRVDAWAEFRYRDGKAVVEAPAWHLPSAEEAGAHAASSCADSSASVAIP